MSHRLGTSTASLHFVPLLRGGSVERRRLSAEVLPTHSGAKLAIVQGPAGTGKTTVLTQWARSSPPHAAAVVWVTLTSDDQSRTVFWERVISAIQDAQVAAPGSYLARLDTTALGHHALGGNLLRAVASLTTPLVLVVDDYHFVNDARVDSDLVAILSQSSDISVVIGTRSHCSLASIETAARIPTVVHDSRNFAFTLAETEILLAQHSLHRSGLAPSIHRATAGWPLATRALLVEARSGSASEDSPQLPAIHGRGRFVHEYVESTLNRRTEDGRLFLLRIAQCDGVTTAFAALLSHITAAEAGAHLVELERDGIATRRASGRITRFVLHPLVHESLRAQSDAELSTTDRAEVLRRYAEWVEPDRPEKSLTLFLELGDLDWAAGVLSRNFSILTSVHADTVLAALQRLAVDNLLRAPVLLSARLLLEHSNPATPLIWMRDWFSLITRSLAQRGPDDPALSFIDLALLTGSERIMGEGTSALARAQVLIRKLADPGSPEIKESRASVPLVHAVVGMTALVNGDFDTADAHYELSRVAAAELELELDEVRGLNGRVLVAAIAGDIVSAHERALACEANVFHRELENHFGAFNFHIARMWMAVEDLNIELARTHRSALGRYEAALETWPYIAIAAGRVQLVTHGPVAALAVFEAMIAGRQNRPNPAEVLRDQLSAFHTMLSILSGDLLRARRVLEQSIDTHDRARSSPLLQLAEARLLLASGNSAGALGAASLVQTALRQEGHGNHRLSIDAHLVSAVAAHRSGKVALADESMSSAVTLLRRTGLRTPMLEIPRADLYTLLSRVDAQAAGSDQAALGLLTGLPDTYLINTEARPLSPAEQRLLRALRREGSAAAAAQALFLSPNTVKSQLRSAYRKLGVSSAREALARAEASAQLD